MPPSDKTPLNSDFADLLHEFNAAGVEFVIVGGQAFGFHAQPRYTKDIDLLVNPEPDNARRVPIDNKRASGRPRDLLDVNELERRRDRRR